MRPTDHRRRERGTQVLELALVLPLLVFLVFVVIEGAAAVRIQQVINNAAREAAHLASLEQMAYYPPDTPDANKIAAIEAAATTYACNNGVLLRDSGGATTCPVATRTTCSSTNINVNQNVSMGTIPETGAQIDGSEVDITCNYKFMFVPNLPYVNYSTSQITLGGTAKFRNQY